MVHASTSISKWISRVDDLYPANLSDRTVTYYHTLDGLHSGSLLRCGGVTIASVEGVRGGKGKKHHKLISFCLASEPRVARPNNEVMY